MWLIQYVERLIAGAKQAFERARDLKMPRGCPHSVSGVTQKRQGTKHGGRTLVERARRRRRRARPSRRAISRRKDPPDASLSSIYFAGGYSCAARRDASGCQQALQTDFDVAGRSHLGGAGDA